MKKSKIFFKVEEKDNGRVFWNEILFKAKKENRIRIKDEEHDINPNIQAYFTNTKLSTKHMDDENKSTVNDIIKNTGFYSMKDTKGLDSARMRDALYNLPKAIAEIRNPLLPAIENIEDVSDNLEGEGLKIFIPSNIIDICTRLEVLL